MIPDGMAVSLSVQAVVALTQLPQWPLVFVADESWMEQFWDTLWMLPLWGAGLYMGWACGCIGIRSCSWTSWPCCSHGRSFTNAACGARMSASARNMRRQGKLMGDSLRWDSLWQGDLRWGNLGRCQRRL